MRASWGATIPEDHVRQLGSAETGTLCRDPEARGDFRAGSEPRCECGDIGSAECESGSSSFKECAAARDSELAQLRVCVNSTTTRSALTT